MHLGDVCEGQLQGEVGPLECRLQRLQDVVRNHRGGTAGHCDQDLAVAEAPSRRRQAEAAAQTQWCRVGGGSSGTCLWLARGLAKSERSSSWSAIMATLAQPHTICTPLWVKNKTDYCSYQMPGPRTRVPSDPPTPAADRLTALLVMHEECSLSAAGVGGYEGTQSCMCSMCGEHWWHHVL